MGDDRREVFLAEPSGLGGRGQGRLDGPVCRLEIAEPFVAALAGLAIYIGHTTVAAFLFMLLGMMLVLWDAHTDSHIPPAPSLT